MPLNFEQTSRLQLPNLIIGIRAKPNFEDNETRPTFQVEVVDDVSLKLENEQSILKAHILSRILLVLSVDPWFIWERSVISLRSKEAIKWRSKIPQQASIVA